MLLFCERAFLCGINGIGAIRHFKANNKYMEDFDKSQPSVFGAFFDVTSVYAGTMQQPLPCGNYKWRTDLTIDDILNADCFGGMGCFVEIDSEYPSHLHDHHNDLPLAPEKLQIKTDWLSDYSKSFGIPASRVAKLVETLFDKNFYICLFRNLKFYVEKRLTVKRFHRVLQFDESCWLGNYISKNTALRKQAKTDFDKYFFKLLSNACFGKTMENLRNCRQTKFFSTELEAKTGTLKPIFLNFQFIHDSLVSLNFTQSSIFWNKPTPAAAAILDFSKNVLYKFHYNEMKPTFGDSLEVVYKNTDSLLYRIETDDLYSDRESSKHLLDLPDFLQNHKLFDSTNKRVPFTMKDELNGQIMLEATCLRSKLYSIKYESGIKQSAKGDQKCVKKPLHHDLFNDVLSSRGNIRKNVTQIQFQQHQLLVTQISKIVMSAFDDTRFILQDGIQSFA